MSERYLKKAEGVKPWLKIAANLIDSVNRIAGIIGGLASLALVIVQALVVVMRYGFAASSFLSFPTIYYQEWLVFIFSLIFLLGTAFAMLHDRHVRVDIFYRSSSLRDKAWVNLWGVFFLLLPFMLIFLFKAWPEVFNSWEIQTGSRDGGLSYWYILYSFIVVFLILILLQGLSLVLRSLLVLCFNEPTGFYAEDLAGELEDEEIKAVKKRLATPRDYD